MSNVYEKLMKIQQNLKCNKGQYNSFGKYKYRSCEDILESVKPLLAENKCTLTMSDEIVCSGADTSPRYYIKAKAVLIDVESGETVENTAYAREEETKKGMDGSQITGTASSYARKYALNGLFAIDDTKDADTNEFTQQTTQKEQVTQKEPLVNENMIAVLTDKAKLMDIEQVKSILAEYGYTKIKEIKVVDFKAIAKKLGCE